MEKKQYIRPVVELIHHDYLCTPDLDAGVSAAEYWDARETDFMEDESEDNAMGYRRYNLWDREQQVHGERAAVWVPHAMTA